MFAYRVNAQSYLYSYSMHTDVPSCSMCMYLVGYGKWHQFSNVNIARCIVQIKFIQEGNLAQIMIVACNNNNDANDINDNTNVNDNNSYILMIITSYGATDVHIYRIWNYNRRLIKRKENRNNNLKREKNGKIKK